MFEQHERWLEELIEYTDRKEVVTCRSGYMPLTAIMQEIATACADAREHGRLRVGRRRFRHQPQAGRGPFTTKLKPYTYVSTVGVPMLAMPPFHDEDADVRVVCPTRPSTTATPTVTTTSSGLPRCCCAKPTSGAGCAWRCSAAT